MTETPKVFSFTTKYEGGISRRLLNDVLVVYGAKSVPVKALWDTGASGTCISYDAAQRLSMTPTGKQNISTPSGLSVVNTYLVDIILPNHVAVRQIPVCDSEIGKQGIGVLIGMDIITHGDFAVSNYNGKTTFSFRIPSCQVTDYVAEADDNIKT